MSQNLNTVTEIFKRQKSSPDLDLAVVVGNSCQPCMSPGAVRSGFSRPIPLSRACSSSRPIPMCSHLAFLLTFLLKIAVEPPQGLKSNLLQMFGYGGSGEVTEEMFEKPDCGPWWKKILFSICLFSAVLIERKAYGTLGWNIPYRFSSSDLEVSVGSGGKRGFWR